MPDARFKQPATALILKNAHASADRPQTIDFVACNLHATNCAELCFYKVGDLAAEP